MDSRPSFRFHLNPVQGHRRLHRELLARFSQSPADPHRLVAPPMRFPVSRRRALFTPVAQPLEKKPPPPPIQYYHPNARPPPTNHSPERPPRTRRPTHTLTP